VLLHCETYTARDRKRCLRDHNNEFNFQANISLQADPSFVAFRASQRSYEDASALHAVCVALPQLAG